MDTVVKTGSPDHISSDLHTIKIDPTPNIVVRCGDGQVVINMKTGTVTLENCTLDAGAKAFWDAVSRYARRE